MANGVMECWGAGMLGPGSEPSALTQHSSTPLLQYSRSSADFDGLTVFNRGSRRESKERQYICR